MTGSEDHPKVAESTFREIHPHGQKFRRNGRVSGRDLAASRISPAEEQGRLLFFPGVIRLGIDSKTESIF